MPNPNPSPATRFKKGQSGNPTGRPKGSRNYKTLFVEAYKSLAQDLKLGKDPDELMIKILVRGIKEALRGDYRFYKDIMDRFYGKPESEVNVNLKHERLRQMEEKLLKWLEKDN